MKTKYLNWTQIQWDGNPDLNYSCWRKSFRNGHVSVGIGEFNLIVYSFGANSDYSMSSTRWRDADKGEQTLTEEQAMQLVDKNNGYCIPTDNPNFRA